jgi:hypothetical protein
MGGYWWPGGSQQLDAHSSPPRSRAGHHPFHRSRAPPPAAAPRCSGPATRVWRPPMAHAPARGAGPAAVAVVAALALPSPAHHHRRHAPVSRPPRHSGDADQWQAAGVVLALQGATPTAAAPSPSLLQRGKLPQFREFSLSRIPAIVASHEIVQPQLLDSREVLRVDRPLLWRIMIVGIG